MNRPFLKILMTAALLASAGTAANEAISTDFAVNSVSNVAESIFDHEPNAFNGGAESAGNSVSVLLSARETRGFLALMTPEFIKFYEDNIAGEKIVTSLSNAKIERMAQQLGVNAEKIRAALIFRDFVTRNGGKIELQQLAAMSDAELFKLGKDNVLKYISSLTPKEKAALDAKFKKLKIW